MHDYHHETVARFNGSGAILIIRDPYRAILAEYKRKLTHSHTGTITEDDLNSDDFDSYSRWMAKRWYLTNTNFIDLVKPLLVVHYESVRKNIEHELQRISEFLGIDKQVNFKDRIKCVIDNQQGSFKRPATQNLTGPFTEKMKNITQIYIQKLSKKLKLNNHPDMPRE